MKINFIELRNFRIFNELRCQFTEKNILLGKNGSGKTTIIESINYASTFSPLRSFETDKDLVKTGEKFFNLKLNFSDDRDFNHNIFVGYEIEEGKAKKKIKLDDKNTNIVSASGKLKVVPFLIEDFELVFGSPSWRRNTINKILFSVSNSYYPNLINYSKIIKRKNALIRIINERKNEEQSGKDIEDMISILRNYNEPLAKYSVYLTSSRLDLVDYVNSFMRSENLPFEINIRYKSNIIDIIKSSSNPINLLLDYLNQNIEKEILYGKSIIGPHIDDVVIYTKDNKIARVFLSQGQVRIVSILFKLGLAKYVQSKTNDFPVLLFDDIIGELDENNKKAFFDKLISLEKTQIILASSEISKDIFKDFNIIRL